MSGTMATTADVLRYLPSDIGDVAPLIEPQLQAADAYARSVLHCSYAEARKTTRFFDVREDAVLLIDDDNPSSVTVTTFTTPDATSGTALDASAYSVDGHRIRLLSTLLMVDATLGGEGGVVRRFPNRYVRVDVTFTPTADVPPMVREAVAGLAAHWYAGSDAARAQLQSESLGDYSYSRGAVADKAVPERIAMKFQMLRVPRVRSTS